VSNDERARAAAAAAMGSFDACGGAAASSGRGVLPVIAALMRTRRMRARASSEPRGVEHPRRRWVAAGPVSGVSSARATAAAAAM